jgi:hypothetical protein
VRFTFKNSIISSALAFIIATSCCWLPPLIIALGGATSLLAFSTDLERFSGLFMSVGLVFLGIGGYQYQQKKEKMKNTQVLLQSTLTCPACSHSKEEIMPTNACQFFYECENCKTVLKPKKGDCCVYCSYATVPCPPIQLNQKCC